MRKLSVVFLSLLILLGTVSCVRKNEIPKEDKVKLIHLHDEVVGDLKGNLLPFWAKYSVDSSDPNQGFYGRIANDGKV